MWISVLLLIGFAVRVWRASGTFLNPDEAMHFQAANQTILGSRVSRKSDVLRIRRFWSCFLHAWR